MTSAEVLVVPGPLAEAGMTCTPVTATLAWDCSVTVACEPSGRATGSNVHSVWPIPGTVTDTVWVPTTSLTLKLNGIPARGASASLFGSVLHTLTWLVSVSLVKVAVSVDPAGTTNTPDPLARLVVTGAVGSPVMELTKSGDVNDSVTV